MGSGGHDESMLSEILAVKRREKRSELKDIARLKEVSHQQWGI